MNWPNTQLVNIVGTLPPFTTIQNVTSNIAQIGGSNISLGQTTKAGGFPVTLPNDVTASITVTPSVTSSSAYTAGNEVGGLMTFANAWGSANSGLIVSVHIICNTIQTGGLKLYLFSANPTNSTWADKTTPAINAADLAFLVGVYNLSSDNGLGTMTIWNIEGISKAVKCSTTSLYGVLVTNGTPNWGGAPVLTVTISTIKD